MSEQMITVMKTNREKTEANIEIGQEPKGAESETELEETEATDLETNA
jgi:hypothetical protein